MDSCTEIASSRAEILIVGTAQTISRGVTCWTVAFKAAGVGGVEVIANGTAATTSITRSIIDTGQARPGTDCTITAIKKISITTNQTVSIAGT